MSSTVITDIGELVTNDPAGHGPLGCIEDAALVVEGGRVAWVGPAADAPAADDDVRRRRPRGASPGFVDSPQPPGLRRRPVGGVRGPDGGRAVLRRRHPHHRRRDPRRHRRAAHRPRRPAGRRDAPPGHHDRRDQERLRAHASTTRRAASRSPRQFTDETTFLGAHVVPAEHATTRATYVDLVTGPMLEAAAPHARWIDVFCERGAFDADQARRILDGRGRGGLRGGCTPTSSAHGPGVRLACELGLAAVDHCTYLTDADVDALARAAPSRRCCRAWSSRPGSPTPTPAACSTPASGSRSPPTATPAPASPARCRSASRWPSGRWG